MVPNLHAAASLAAGGRIACRGAPGAGSVAATGWLGACER